MLMVVTLKGGAQIKVGVKEFTVRRGRLDGNLLGVDWVYDDNPLGSSLNWLDTSQVAAIHTERGPGDTTRNGDPASAGGEGTPEARHP